jgi:hypothetical protein
MLPLAMWPGFDPSLVVCGHCGPAAARQRSWVYNDRRRHRKPLPFNVTRLAELTQPSSGLLAGRGLDCRIARSDGGMA